LRKMALDTQQSPQALWAGLRALEIPSANLPSPTPKGMRSISPEYLDETRDARCAHQPSHWLSNPARSITWATSVAGRQRSKGILATTFSSAAGLAPTRPSGGKFFSTSPPTMKLVVLEKMLKGYLSRREPGEHIPKKILTTRHDLNTLQAISFPLTRE